MSTQYQNQFTVVCVEAYESQDGFCLSETEVETYSDEDQARLCAGLLEEVVRPEEGTTIRYEIRTA